MVLGAESSLEDGVLGLLISELVKVWISNFLALRLGFEGSRLLTVSIAVDEPFGLASISSLLPSKLSCESTF